MAQVTSTPGDGCFAGNPVVYLVESATYNKAVFQRLRIVVSVTDGTNEGEFEFSQPVNGQETVQFDISSALCAILEKHQYAADTLSGYPTLIHKVKPFDDYLIDGEEKHVAGTESETYTAYAGGLTDRERLTNARPTRYSRKPTASPEIVHLGKTLIVAGAFGGTPSVTSVEITSQTAATATYYPIAAPVDSYEMRFINSLGVHESIHVACLPITETHIQTEEYVVAVQETLTRFSRGITRKQNDQEHWKMSSGPLDRAWQQWYLHEVLMSEQAWIKIDGVWLPVHIVPEETVTGADRTKADALTVEFTIRFDINGSPFA